MTKQLATDDTRSGGNIDVRLPSSPVEPTQIPTDAELQARLDKIAEDPLPPKQQQPD